MTIRTRRIAVAALALPSLALAGCASQTDTSDWANAVCTSLAQVRSDIDAIGEGLRVELGGTQGSALEQITEQLAEDADAVRTSLEELNDAVQAVPATSGAEDLASLLEAQSEDFDAAVTEVGDAASRAAEATSIPDFLAATGEAVSALADASAATTAYVATLRTGVADAADELRQSFDEAPACDEVLGTS